MATRSQTTTAYPKANGGLPAEVREALRSKRAAGVTLAELRKAHPDLNVGAIRAAVAGAEPATKTSGKRAPVTTKRVRPQEPDYFKLPEGKREEARKAYERALADFEGKPAAQGRVPKQPPVRAKRAAAKAKQAAADAKPGDPKASDAVPVPAGFKSWQDPKLAAKVVAMKTKNGYTIKPGSTDDRIAGRLERLRGWFGAGCG